MKLENKQIDTMLADVKGDRASVKKLPTKIEIQNYVVNYLAELLQVKPNRIDVTISFERYGLDSSVVLELAGELQSWLDEEIDPTLFYNYPTVEALSQQLIKELKDKA
ncbi:MAG: acyl carrier protein [Nostocales cyanobacterium 94392]|nr:acyl carrier protein [Nostocales cyanobacterium 94392]